MHSPFRWVFPFTLSMAALGAIGLNVVLGWMERGARGERRGGEKQRGRQGEGESPISQSPISNLPISQSLAALLAFAGLAALLAVLASMFCARPLYRLWPARRRRQRPGADGLRRRPHVLELPGREPGALRRHARCWLGCWSGGECDEARGGEGETGRPKSPISDLQSPAPASSPLHSSPSPCSTSSWRTGRFNPASDPALSPLSEQGVPPAVRFINEREGGDATRPGSDAQPWRFTTFNVPGEKTFNANVGMYYGWQDIRGYDSIIPRQYVDFMNRIQPQDERTALQPHRAALCPTGRRRLRGAGQPAARPAQRQVPADRARRAQPELAGDLSGRRASASTRTAKSARASSSCPRRASLPVEEQPLTTTDLRSVVFIEETAGRRERTRARQPAVARGAHQPLHGQRRLCRRQPERPRLAGAERRLLSRLEGVHAPLWRRREPGNRTAPSTAPTALSVPSICPTMASGRCALSTAR